jgi:hypothetical protein
MKIINSQAPHGPVVLSFDFAQTVETSHQASQPASFYFFSLK